MWNSILILIWFANCVIVNQSTLFSINDRKRYVLVVTLSTQDNEKLLKQLKSGVKRAIYWNKSIDKKTKPIFRLINWSKVFRE